MPLVWISPLTVALRLLTTPKLVRLFPFITLLLHLVGISATQQHPERDMILRDRARRPVLSMEVLPARPMARTQRPLTHLHIQLDQCTTLSPRLVQTPTMVAEA
ncbi:hypothetical protein M407DRAFT_245610 [Tulasnella calospora MUT 4182]|uniref:Uncharacterized protein n=1 Tax=Tulasnella calospora MUT 4182 TaxID=1051891 RepID=A0A0C3QAC1_9AGAM|nr:hypothetical protein M407DRAFT_245610 [Tulasnella calospora MUT 4182]